MLFLTSAFTIYRVGVEYNFTVGPLLLAVLTVSDSTSTLVQISLLNSVQFNMSNSLLDVVIGP